MSSSIEIKIYNLKENNISLIYPSIINSDNKREKKLLKLQKILASTSILEQKDDFEEEKNDLNNGCVSEKKKKKKKKLKRKKKKCLSINFKYKLKKDITKKKENKYKIKSLSRSVPKLKFRKKNKEKNNSYINIPIIDNFIKNNNNSNSTKKILNYYEEININNNSNVKEKENENEYETANNNINLNKKTRVFNFRNKINYMINTQKYLIKKKKKICMTPKPKIILNPGGNEADSMNGGHSNNYTSKYLIGKALHYNNSLEGQIGEGIDTSAKINIRGKKNAVAASINKTNPNNIFNNNNNEIIEDINKNKDEKKELAHKFNLNVNDDMKMDDFANFVFGIHHN